jgi:hypothetical protein
LRWLEEVYTSKSMTARMDLALGSGKETRVSNLEVVGGIPLLSVIGTPRTMGANLGQRLKPRLQVLSQYLMEQLASATQATGVSLTARDLRESLRSSALAAARLEPSLWMEIESMARAADLPEEDLLLIHGYGDLLSTYRCNVAPSRSTYISLGAPHTDSGLPRMVLAWHLDPSLLPYVSLLRRIPAHGPASLSLTLAGLHPVAGLSEAGLAVACNELRVTDGINGQFTSHLLGSVLTAPTLDDALTRVQVGPRHGGAALHLLSNGGERITMEMSGQHQVRLLDPFQSSPRVHTNHPLHEEIVQFSAQVSDLSSKTRLESIASHAIDAISCSPAAIAGWFGLDERDTSQRPTRYMNETGISAETTILMIIDPGAKAIHLRRGGSSSKLETVRL